MRKKICRNKLEKSASTKKEKNGKNPIGDYRVEKVGQPGALGY
jgi:hypothetical protein